MHASSAPFCHLRLLAIPLLAGLVLAACGGDDDDADTPATSAATSTAPAATPPPSDGSTSTEFNDADVEFAQGMIPHHEQAIEMAEIALDPTRQAGAEVTDLAARIRAGQDPEIETLTSWLTAWGQTVEMDTSDGHDMSSMPGMMSVEDMDAMATMTGAEFDQLWLTMMVVHHQGAIDMAIKVHGDGAHADVKTLATQIVNAQQAELDEMNALLGT
jgi:uncharacterized protein (DUF305 family)